MANCPLPTKLNVFCDFVRLRGCSWESICDNICYVYTEMSLILLFTSMSSTITYMDVYVNIILDLPIRILQCFDNLNAPTLSRKMVTFPYIIKWKCLTLWQSTLVNLQSCLQRRGNENAWNLFPMGDNSPCSSSPPAGGMSKQNMSTISDTTNSDCPTPVTRTNKNIYRQLLVCIFFTTKENDIIC